MRITCMEEAPKRMALRILDSIPIKSVYTEDNHTHEHIAFLDECSEEFSNVIFISLSFVHFHISTVLYWRHNVCTHMILTHRE